MGRTLSKNWIRLLIVFLTAFGVALVVSVTIGTKVLNRDKANEDIVENEESSDEADIEETITPTFIDLQPTVDAWLATAPGKVGLMIYDLDNQQVAAEYQSNVVFEAASVYKLFFAYDGYMQIDAGVDDGEAYFTSTSDYDNLSLSDCLDKIIRESYNGCADPLRADAARFARAEALADRLELTGTSSAGLYSTAADLTKLMQLYWEHPDLSAASWEAIQDSMLNQPPTTYNWRQGLPSGFSQALVYDKVGWNYTGSYWSIYDDVAFVVFPEQDRHYIVVVMTSGFPTFTPLVNLGAQLETAILEQSVL